MRTRKKFISDSVKILTFGTMAGGSLIYTSPKVMSMSAATTGRITDPPYNCKGDGSDETAQIQRCINEHRYVEIPEPPAGVGYGINPLNSLELPDGVEIYGTSPKSRFVRVGREDRPLPYGSMMRTSAPGSGNTSIKLHNLEIRGDREAFVRNGVSDYAHRSAAITIGATSNSTVNRDVTITDVRVMDWPGVGIRSLNVVGLTLKDILVENPSRGGIITTRSSSGINFTRARAVGTGDDSISFNCVESPSSPLHGLTRDITLTACSSSVRPGSRYGAPLKFLGAREATVKDSVFRGGRSSSVTILSVRSTHKSSSRTYNPSDIRITDCEMYTPDKYCFHVFAYSAERIYLGDSLLSRPKGYCASIQHPDERPSRLSVLIERNRMVRPQKGRHLYIGKGIRGVIDRNNRKT